MNPTVALIPSAYKSGLVYSILPASGRGDFNFNRPSSATRVNKDGLVEEMPILIGNNLITNGTFDTDLSGWFIQSGDTNWVWDNGSALMNVTGGGSSLIQDFGGNNTTIYEVKVDATLTGTKGCRVLDANSNNLFLTNGSNTFITTLFIGRLYLKPSNENGTGEIRIDNVTVNTYIANVPRLDYTNGNCPQLLLERASTNLCLYSQSNFNDQVNWLKFLAPNNLTITEDDIISPDGTLSGAKIEYVNNGQDAVFTQNITVVNGANYVLSIWLKGKQGGEVVKMRLSNNSGGSSGTTDTFTLTDEWVRYETNIKVADAINRGFQLRMEQVGNPLGATFYAWGAQLENLTYATSYIPTEATTVTRSRDLMTDSMAGRPEITSNDWTLFLDFNKSDLGSDNCVSINDGTNDNSIVINNRADDELAFILNQGGTVLSSYIYDITGIDDLKVSFSSTDTGASMVVNGVEIDRLDDGRFDASSLIQIDFTEYGTTNEFAGRVNDFRYYNVALSLNERIKLTQ